MKNSFYIAGGDLRSVYLAKSLSEEGYKTAVFALEKANLPEDIEMIEKTENFKNAEIVILPLPSSDSEGFLKTAFSEKKTKLSEIVEHLPENSVLIGGLLPKDIVSSAKEKGIFVFDY